MRIDRKNAGVSESRFEDRSPFSDGDRCIGEVRSVCIDQVREIPLIGNLNVEKIRALRVANAVGVIVIERVNAVVIPGVCDRDVNGAPESPLSGRCSSSIQAAIFMFGESIENRFERRERRQNLIIFGGSTDLMIM